MEPYNLGSNESGVWSLQTNPLQIHTVIKSITEFLPFKEILKLRLLCQSWEFTSHSVMRNLGKVVLSSNFRPTDFLDYYSHAKTRPLPMKSFKFAQDGLSEDWAFFDLMKFLIHHGGEVQYLEFDFPRKRSRASSILNDWNRWRLYVPHLVELKVTVDLGSTITLALTSLTSLKSLSLNNCVLNLDDMENRKISPQKISLINMHYTQDGVPLDYVLLNAFLNFRSCSEMEFVNYCMSLVVAYDISKDRVRARKMKLDNIEVINWRSSYAEIEQLTLTHCPLERINKVQVKELIFIDSDLNLSYLPKTIEKLSIDMQDGLLIGRVDSPNLKSLRINDRIIHEFADCGSIVNVELTTEENTNGQQYALPKTDLPKNTNRLKVLSTQEIDGTEAINVDHLIIEKCTTPCATANRLLRNITAKVLVISLQETIISEETDDILEFVSKNEKLQEIVVLFPHGLKDANLFCKDTVNYDGESYLVFRGKKLGISLTKGQFERYFNIY